MTIRTRFAPSPTGRLHVGNLRTALMNWLLARASGGHFILRIDDTDADRSQEAYVDAIRSDLEWLGLDWDEEQRQSLRLDRYAAAADRLRAAERLYDCYETPEELDLRRKAQLSRRLPPVYDRAALDLAAADKQAFQADGRSPHWRFLLNRTQISFADLIRGDTAIDAASVSDPVLIRGDGQVLYTLASVVDDAEMGVTHIVRGADHVTNSAAQIQIFEALGASPPALAHHSLLTGAEGEKLSKRLGGLALGDLREAGVEPMALLSMLARLGSSDPVEPRMSPSDLIAGFDITRFGLAPTKFDPADLQGLTARILHETPFEAARDRLASMGVEGADAETFWLAVRGNLERFADAGEWWTIVTDGVEPRIEPEDAAFVEQAMTLLPPRPWDDATWKAWTGAVKVASGRKGRGLFLPLRRALTGRDHGPEMAALMPLLRKV